LIAFQLKTRFVFGVLEQPGKAVPGNKHRPGLAGMRCFDVVGGHRIEISGLQGDMAGIVAGQTNPVDRGQGRTDCNFIQAGGGGFKSRKRKFKFHKIKERPAQSREHPRLTGMEQLVGSRTPEFPWLQGEWNVLPGKEDAYCSSSRLNFSCAKVHSE
jgi:hypothetical protein